MRIVIDMQGAQGSSAKRGIGRYTLALAHALIKSGRHHEILLALNGANTELTLDIRSEFAGILPEENIKVWHTPKNVSELFDGKPWLRTSAEMLREAFLAKLQPDVLLVSSLFEGLDSSTVTSIGRLTTRIPTAVILFDLIPYLHRLPYLQNRAIESWYERKLDDLRRADAWLAISEATRSDAIRWLSLPRDRVVNISSAVDDSFRVVDLAKVDIERIRERYRLFRPFVMYTGGIDHRKNIEGLIKAFAKLPRDTRKAHQLVIVCSIQDDSRTMLSHLASSIGLDSDELVLTGYVPEDDLIGLYNMCSLFVFSSTYEGFGLPVLEAMRCGAAVISADTSSIPEIIGWDEAMFDPRSEDSISAKMLKALSDDGFRSKLIENGSRRVKSFSWKATAARALDAIEELHRSTAKKARHHSEKSRPKLAYFSPLPPERSGIAGFSVELLPELARHYDIDVIVAQKNVSDTWVQANVPVRNVQWFEKNAASYGRILYHFGNSMFHEHMIDLLERFPGVVVLHDFFLSGLHKDRQIHAGVENAWNQELFRSHGYLAIWEHLRTNVDAVLKYPCSQKTVENASGVIVHSTYSAKLIREHYGAASQINMRTVPLARAAVQLPSKQKARAELGIDEDAFVVCSFGILAPTKLNHRLMDAWSASTLSGDERCKLVFVGLNGWPEYAARLEKKQKKRRAEITGWVSEETYRTYLAAADVAVQLRTDSRGETSAAILDCLNAGLPTIINANGSMAEIDPEVVIQLDDIFIDKDLVDALDRLFADAGLRRTLAKQAQDYAAIRHSPRLCADMYSDFIES
ncbi:MAG: glycosyltransferase, partial [Mesorhizobium sp.]